MPFSVSLVLLLALGAGLNRLIRLERRLRVYREATTALAADRRIAPLPQHLEALVAEFLEAEGAQARVAAFNEWLEELRELRELGRAWPRALSRIALFSGFAVAFFEFAMVLGGDGTWLVDAVACLVVGATAWLGAAHLGRRLARGIQAAASALDALRRTVTPAIPRADGAPRERGAARLPGGD